MKTIIIMGSSRSDGDTATVVQKAAKLMACDIVDLNDLSFTDYDYQSNNMGDDFLPMIRKVVNEYDHIIWTTPVYWYSMSAIMKRFIDRISDCLRIEKETGRKFRGMSMSLLSVSNDVRNEAYDIPFKLSAEYLGMSYLGDQHVIINEEKSITEQLKPFIDLISNHQSDSI